MSTVQKLLEKKGHHVYAIRREASVLEAARLMNDHHIGALVVAHDDKAVGIFTERDILCRVVATQRDPVTTKVGDVMTAPVATCAPSTTRHECRAVMRERRLRHLPVVEDGRLMGMVSIGDLNEAVEADHEQTIQYLTGYVLGDWQ